MGETKNEYRLLLPLLPFLAIVPLLSLLSDTSPTDFAWLIVVAPFIMFPVILITGQVYNKNETWKNTWKEGGILGLAALSVSLSTTIWIVYDYLIGHADIQENTVASWLEWISFDVLQSDYTISQNRILGVDVWVDSLTLMLLFVATFLCFLICWFAIGYMTTDPINEDSNHRFFAEFVLFSLGMFGMVLADNFLWLFIFWEVMGLCSYLLIGNNHRKLSARTIPNIPRLNKTNSAKKR